MTGYVAPGKNEWADDARRVERVGAREERDEMAEMKAEFPLNWRIGQDFDPNDHLMQLKGRDYLNVQSRLLWFIRDQRALIVAGLATMPYIVRSELVEQDREAGWAHFKTYVRDVLGNETTMYGSESAKDFGDYAEKASTKSLGRALLALGYGTAFAPEMDEGERVVDAPVERKQQRKDNKPDNKPQPARIPPEPSASPYPTPGPPRVLTERDIHEQQRLIEQIRRHGFHLPEIVTLCSVQLGAKLTAADIKDLQEGVCVALSTEQVVELTSLLRNTADARSLLRTP